MKSTTSRFLISLVTVLGSVLLWTGCDPASTTPSTPSSSVLLNACTLLDSTEAAVILGKPLLSIKLDTTASYIAGCTYTGDTTAGQYYLPPHIRLTVFTTAGVQAHLSPTLNVPAYFANVKATTPASNQLQVTGVGDDAIWYTKVGKLEFYKGDVFVDVIFSKNGIPAIDTSAVSLNGAKAAAIKVAARL